MTHLTVQKATVSMDQTNYFMEPMTLLVVCTPPSIYHIVNIKFIQRTLQLKQSKKITAVQKQEQT